MVFRRFFCEDSTRRPKKLPRRSRTLPRRAETPPRGAQDAPRRPGAPQDAPRRPQDEAQGEPGAEKIGPDLGSKSDLQRTLLQSSIFECFGMDFGKVLGRFSGAIEIDFSWILRVISQVQISLNLSKLASCRPRRRASEPRSGVARCSGSCAQGSLESWLAADPVVARVSREAA